MRKTFKWRSSGLYFGYLNFVTSVGIWWQNILFRCKQAGSNGSLCRFCIWSQLVKKFSKTQFIVWFLLAAVTTHLPCVPMKQWHVDNYQPVSWLMMLFSNVILNLQWLGMILGSGSFCNKTLLVTKRPIKKLSSTTLGCVGSPDLIIFANREIICYVCCGPCS